MMGMNAAQLADAIERRMAVDGQAIVANWLEQRGGTAKPLTGAVVGGTVRTRSRTFLGLVYEPRIDGSSVRQFAEIEAGDKIVDLPVSAVLPDPQQVAGVTFTLAQHVRVASTANLSLNGPATVDGVAVAADDRVLAWMQTNPEENWIYRANLAGAWEPDTDVPGFANLPIYVLEGETYARTGFRLTDPLAVVFNVATAGEVEESIWVLKPTGRVLAQAWDARKAGVRIVRTVVLRRAT